MRNTHPSVRKTPGFAPIFGYYSFLIFWFRFFSGNALRSSSDRSSISPCVFLSEESLVWPYVARSMVFPNTYRLGNPSVVSDCDAVLFPIACSPGSDFPCGFLLLMFARLRCSLLIPDDDFLRAAHYFAHPVLAQFPNRLWELPCTSMRYRNCFGLRLIYFFAKRFFVRSPAFLLPVLRDAVS